MPEMKKKKYIDIKLVPIDDIKVLLKNFYSLKGFGCRPVDNKNNKTGLKKMHILYNI